MKRQTITQYVNANFEPGSGPSHATVIRRLKNGQLKGVKIGGTWYVEGENLTGDQGLADLFADFDNEAAHYAHG